MKQFKSYAFNCSLNGVSVAIYEDKHDNSYTCVVEKDGEPCGGFVEKTYFARFIEDGVESALATDFVSNDDDIYTNQALVLSEVLSGLCINDETMWEM